MQNVTVTSKRMVLKSVKFEVVKSYCIAVCNFTIPGINALQMAVQPGITIRTIAPYGATPEEVTTWQNSVTKLVGTDMNIATVTVDGFEDYVRLDENHQVRRNRNGEVIVYDKIVIYEYADADGNPCRSENALLQSAIARFRNSKTICTVAAIKAQQEAKKAAKDALQEAKKAAKDALQEASKTQNNDTDSLFADLEF